MTNVIKQLASEFWIPVPELEKAMQDRHQWRRMVNSYHGTRRLRDNKHIFVIHIVFEF